MLTRERRSSKERRRQMNSRTERVTERREAEEKKWFRVGPCSEVFQAVPT